MPSFKTILASLALVALSFSSVSASSVHHNGGVVRRSNVAARDVSPSPAVARRAAAAKALKKRAMFKGKASSIMKGTRLAAIAGRIRCGTNKVCENRAPLGPANSANVCYRGACAYACNTGFAQQGDQCVATLTANQQCGGQTCDVPANGYALCNNGACEVGCNLGFTRYSTSGNLNGPYTCIDTANDASRCGTGANLVACPASYNGVGTPECRNSVCRIACPTGSTLRRADSTSNPYYCYSGEGSLVM